MRQKRGRWQSEFIATPVAMAEAITTDSGLVVAAIQSDSTLPTDGSSLLLRSERLGWGVIRVIRPSRIESVTRIRATRLDERRFLNWESTVLNAQAVRSLEISPGYSSLPFTVEAHPAPGTPIAPVLVPPLGPVWVTMSQEPGAAGEINFTALDSAGMTSRLGSLKNPFAAGFRAMGGTNRLVLSGAVNARQYVASMLVSADVHCLQSGE